MPLQSWVGQLLKSLRRLFKGAPAATIKIVEQYYSGNTVVLRIDDESIPGAVDLWRIDRQYDRIRFFICIINISKLRQELAVGGRNSRGQSRGQLVDHLWQSVGAQAHIQASHYWIVGWDKEFMATDTKGRTYRSHRLSDVVLYAVDLQGAASAYAGDRYALRYARKIIKQLAANNFRELNQHQTWVAAVKAINWLQWLEALSKSTECGINADHVLQPKRSRIKNPR